MTNTIINGILVVTFAGMAYGTKSCNSTEKKQVAEAECPTDILCTMDFRTLTVKVQDETNRPVVLDSFYSILNATGERLTSETMVEIWNSHDAHREGNYLVADDSHKALVGKAGKTITFTGYKNGERILSENLVVGHDCCHIQMISGNEEITLKGKF